MKVTRKGDTTHIQITRWDLFLGWLRHVVGRCGGLCSYCYEEGCKWKAEQDKKMYKRSFELQRYIEQQQREECQGNAADHRPTPQYALDEITERAHKQYVHGQEFLATVSDSEKAQMRAYHKYMHNRSWTPADNLVTARIQGKWMLVPYFMADIEAARHLQDILTK